MKSLFLFLFFVSFSAFSYEEKENVTTEVYGKIEVQRMYSLYFFKFPVKIASINDEFANQYIFLHDSKGIVIYPESTEECKIIPANSSVLYPGGVTNLHLAVDILEPGSCDDFIQKVTHDNILIKFQNTDVPELGPVIILIKRN